MIFRSPGNPVDTLFTEEYAGSSSRLRESRVALETRHVAGHASTREMVCDCAASECSTELGEDASLKRALEELLKCMLRVWCTEGRALTRLGADVHGKLIILFDAF